MKKLGQKKMKQVLIFGMLLLLASCGGSDRRDSRVANPAPLRSVPLSFGPISKACMASDRKARSRELCGCIQTVADQTLSNGQQRRAVAFYNDPHSAQVIRQSGNSNDERFWEAYSAYSERAKSICG